MTGFATCSYQEFRPGMGIAVRATVGEPKFPLRYQLAGNWQQAAPDRAFLHAPEDQFRERYLAKLERTGPEQFREMATALRAASRNAVAQLALAVDQDGDGPIVLLCFDKLWLPDAFCHRRLFAGWWLERTGEAVPELGRTQ